MKAFLQGIEVREPRLEGPLCTWGLSVCKQGILLKELQLLQNMRIQLRYTPHIYPLIKSIIIDNKALYYA